MAQSKNLILDLSNIIWMIYHAEVKNTRDQSFITELLVQEAIKHVCYAAQRFGATGILVACDSPRVWRKDFYPEYKANRDEEVKIHWEEVKAACNMVQEFFNTCTAIPAISVPKAEADDVIAVAARMSSVPVLIISGDKDFIQLIDKNVSLYSPNIKKERTSENPKFELFVKCIRGDKNDNVESAFPRVRETRLEKAFNDGVEMMNLMETVLPDGRKVADLYARNRRLIDLNEIPSDIVDSIATAIETSLTVPHKYDYIAIVKTLSKNNLKELAKQVSSFTEIFKKRFTL